MTLKTLITTIESVASNQPSIKTIVENDVFRLNAKSDTNYGVFAWTQGQHTANLDSSLMTYSFTFFYVDRLTNDKSNQVEIQSFGIQTISNILRSLDDYGISATSFNFQPFNQRFLDECAGVFCSVSFDVPVNSVCDEDFTITNNVEVW